MTVTYTSQVADCKGFGCFWRLLFRWRGSIYKLVYTDLLAYSFLYYLLSGIYRYILDADGKRIFEKIAIYTEYYTELIPISFVLGFYVSIVVKRWWEQFELLPWPDSLSLYISTSIPGNDDRGRMMRRTIVRYANLSFTLTLIMVSPTIKKRFPTLDHLIEAGLLTANERKIFDDLSTKTTHPMYWMPLVWAGTVVARARKEGRIRDDFAVKTIIDEINRLRGLCGHLLSYDWISVPLVYTQVVTLAVYTFFLATLMGRQFLDTSQNYEKHNLDLVFPVFTYLQFFFYMGWLKVAESLVNPFGEDDDDFEVNWLVDRNVQISYLIVDEMHNEHPELIQDIYWDEIFPTELPYTIASQEFRTEPPQGSTAYMEVPTEDQEILPMVEEETQDEMLDNPSASTMNMKRIGSNLSAMFQHPSSLVQKSSVLSFLHRSTTSIRKPSYIRNLQRMNSKSSGLTISPVPTNRGAEAGKSAGTAGLFETGRTVPVKPENMECRTDHLSEGSLSGSDIFIDQNQIHSSKESITTDTTTFSDAKKGRRRTTFEDIGIQFSIKKGDKNDTETKEGQPSEAGKGKNQNSGGEKSEASVVTPTEQQEQSLHPKPKRAISIDSPYSHATAELSSRVSIEGKDFVPGSAPSKLLDYMKTTTKNSSSPSLKDQGTHKSYSSRRRTRSSSTQKPPNGDIQPRKVIPRGNKILRSYSSNTFESAVHGDHSRTILSAPVKYSPLTHTVVAIPQTSQDNSKPTAADSEAPMSTAMEEPPGDKPSNWDETAEGRETRSNGEGDEREHHTDKHNESDVSIWL